VREDSGLREGEHSRPESGAPAVLPTKLRPALTRRVGVPERFGRLLRPRPGSLVLVHAAAGYGKTTALAMTQEAGWLWYNVDSGDQSPLAVAARLCSALGLQPPPRDLPSNGEAMAIELAGLLAGRALTVTLDRFELIGEAHEAGRLLSDLLELAPGLSMRLATRIRPPLPLERLRLAGRLIEVGPAELRLNADEIIPVLADCLGRPPTPSELHFADSVLSGWPGALHLWLAGRESGDAALMAPLRPGTPLHDYLHEELLLGTLSHDAVARMWADRAWLVGQGPLVERASTPERRRVADSLVRDRVGVVPGRGGWHVHPLVRAFLAMHIATRPERSAQGEGHLAVPFVIEPVLTPVRDRAVTIRALGELEVEVGGSVLPDSFWPSASRRVLELLLSMPGYQVSARQAGPLLWPRHLPSSALNSFNVALHGLRRLLQPELSAGAASRFVIREGRTYRLCVEELTCDVEDFSRLIGQVWRQLDDESGRKLEMAAVLYRGDFLSSSTDQFARDRRRQLRRLMLEALEGLGEWHAKGGRHAQALGAFNRLLELGPHREDIWARVLESHLEAGDEHRALAALQQCEQSLAAAGIEPSGLLKELRSRVRREVTPPDSRHAT
jgi:DNA-binding SARP family transcriptional activator